MIGTQAIGDRMYDVHDGFSLAAFGPLRQTPGAPPSLRHGGLRQTQLQEARVLVTTAWSLPVVPSTAFHPRASRPIIRKAASSGRPPREPATGYRLRLRGGSALRGATRMQPGSGSALVADLRGAMKPVVFGQPRQRRGTPCRSASPAGPPAQYPWARAQPVHDRQTRSRPGSAFRTARSSPLRGR